MGKGSNYRPVDRDKYDEGYKKVFGVCKHKTCPSRYNCLRWLETPCFGGVNVFDFTPINGKCKYFCENKHE